jgi:uncharacterized protein YndB with AHSA1/START domain
MNGTLETRDHRPAVRFERRLVHSPERVWRAITDPAELRNWFPAEVEVDLRPGGAIRFTFPDQGTGAGEITALDPPHLLEYTWDGAVLRFELRPEGEGCVLVFSHIFDERDAAPKFAAGWHLCLERLDSALDGTPVAESMDRWNELYQRYAESLGVARPPRVQAGADGTVERTDDGRYVLRFERHLRWPVERVWRSLTTPEELVKWLAEADIDLREGGRVELRWLNTDAEGNHGIARGTITALEPPTIVQIDTDGHGRLRWELTRDEGDTCILTFTETAELSQEQAAENLGGWHMHLDHLEESLEGRPVDWPNWWRDYGERWAEYRDRYAGAPAGRAPQ